MSVEISDKMMSKIPAAANTGNGSNPAYALSDFTADFPQFAKICTGDNPTIPAALSQKFIGIANSSLPSSKYGEAWKYCMGLYVAHFCTMFLSSTRGDSSAQGILKGAQPMMLQSSKGVGDVSESFDTSSAADDFKGFGSLKMTAYGQQLATFAKVAGMGGALVW